MAAGTGHPTFGGRLSAPLTLTLEALARTLLLLRDHIRPEVPDGDLAAALLSTRVALVGDHHNLQTQSAQQALVTTALLTARSGASVHLVVPDLPLLGDQPPLRGDRLSGALLDVLDDLIPGVKGVPELPSGPVDLALVVGDSPWSGSARRVIRLQADAWSGGLASGGGSRWDDYGSPFGALASAGLAAGECFKVAVRRLRPHALNHQALDELFSPIGDAAVRLAPPGTPLPTGRLGTFDCVSGGAIIQAALYALARLNDVTGDARVIEPETAEPTNLNRYSLLRRSQTAAPKAVTLSKMRLGGIHITPVIERYDARLRERLTPHAPAVLVGVDDIPSRWEVQAAQPHWLGVGATTHYSAMASYHVAGLGCVRCLHPRDDPGAGPIPTVSFVSHWAGLWLASLFARERIAARPQRSEQSVYFTSLRADAPAALWLAPVAARADCPFKCYGEE